MSECYDIRKEEIENEFFTPQSDYYTNDETGQLTLMEDELEY
jgi:hypothetical protein